MKTLAAIVITVGALAIPCAAQAQVAAPQTAPVTFSLTVAGPSAPGTTFWVSYGPLDGKFAIIRLHAEDSHRFGVTIDLPSRARGTFYYLTGHGTMKTRIGLVPGNPVSTIKHVGPMVVRRRTMVAASWHPPLG